MLPNHSQGRNEMNRGCMRHFRRVIRLFCVMILIVGSIEHTAVAAEKVRIAAGVSWPAYAYWEIIKTQHLAPDLDLEVVILDDPISGYALLSTDQFQVLNNTIDYAPIAAEQGLPIRQVTLATIS